MKTLHLSDTHRKHLNFTQSIETIVQAQRIDVTVHSGDFSDYAITEETEFFLRWFKLKILNIIIHLSRGSSASSLCIFSCHFSFLPFL